MKNLRNRKRTVVNLSMGVALGTSLFAGFAGPTGSALAASKNGTSANSTAFVNKYEKEPTLVTITRGVSVDPNQKYPKGQNLTDNAYTRMLKSKFNIQVKNAFATSSASYPQEVNLAIASGHIPDYMVGLTYSQYRAVVKAGLAMDISKVWNEYASPQTKGVYNSNKALFNSLVMQDGKMYGIPSSNPTTDFLQVVWIRKDWLDKLGLKPPVTMNQLEADAKAFVDKAPGGPGTVGIVGPGTNGPLYQDLSAANMNFDFDPIFSYYDSFPGIWIKNSQGQAVYGSIQPQTKAALLKLAQMYKQGLISPGMLTSNTAQLVANNKAGMFFGTWWDPFADIGTSWQNDKSADWEPYILPTEGAHGVYLAKGGNAAQTFTVISKNCKNPEAVIKMLNIFKAGLQNDVSASDEATLGDGFYPMYQTYSLSYGPAMVLQAVNSYFEGKKTVAQIHSYLSHYDAYENQSFDQIVAAKKKPYSNTSISGWDFTGNNAQNFGTVWSFGVGLRPYVEGKYRFVTSLSYLTTPTMEQRWANLTSLEYQTFSKIITGQAPISAFDTFVQQWNAEGGAQITQEIRASLKK